MKRQKSTGKLELSKAMRPFFFGSSRYRRFTKALAICQAFDTEEETTVSTRTDRAASPGLGTN